MVVTAEGGGVIEKKNEWHKLGSEREWVDFSCGWGRADQGEMEVSRPRSSVWLPDEG